MMAHSPRVIIVGGGLAGLAASARVAEAGMDVDLFSMVPVKRSHSVCAQGGINAATEPVKQEGFSEWNHFDETLYGGDFLNHQAPVYEMAYWAPKVIDILDRMGVPFNRTPEGFLDRRKFGGSLFRRTHFAGASTGQQLLYALDEQTRRYEVEGKVTKYEFWEFLWPVIDEDGECKGIIAQDMRSMEIKAFRGDAVVMATGGNGVLFGKSTMSTICTGGAAARCYQAGAWLGNAEMVQVHPTAIPGEDKCRLMSESARGEGGRVWVPAVKKGGKWQPHPNPDTDPRQIPEDERWYILEEKYPEYKNLVSRDVATREIFDACQKGFGVGGGNMAYLDITHLPQATKNKLAAILEIYEKFTGDDPREMPMKIFPAVHYSMGGLYTVYETEKDQPTFLVDFIPSRDDEERDPSKTPHPGMIHDSPYNMMTNIKGLYAFGEVNYQYHGATRLGANALLSCIFDGLYCGLGVVNYVRDVVENRAADLPDELYDKLVQQEEGKVKTLTESTGEHNPYALHRELGEVMTAECTVVRTMEGMQKALDQVRDIKNRYDSVTLSDTGLWTNQNLSFARALRDMIVYAEAMLLSGIARKETRGCHFCTDFPDRDDEKFLKTAVAQYDSSSGEHTIAWEDVPMTLVRPRARTYGKSTKTKEEKKQTAAAK